MYFVDVQNPNGGEWTRRFCTIDEAERYREAAINERGYVASIRKCIPKVELKRYL